MQWLQLKVVREDRWGRGVGRKRLRDVCGMGGVAPQGGPALQGVICGRDQVAHPGRAGPSHGPVLSPPPPLPPFLLPPASPCGARYLPPLPHQQGACAAGRAPGAATAGTCVRRPGAGPWLRARLPGHPPGFRAHGPRAALSAAATASATTSWVSRGRCPPGHTPLTQDAGPVLPGSPWSGPYMPPDWRGGAF